MKTPKNIAGQITESIMAKVSEKLPDIKTHEYNRTFEATYDVLSGLMISGDNQHGVVLVPDNDWAFMARVVSLPKDKKRRFYEAVEILFFD